MSSPNAGPALPGTLRETYRFSWIAFLVGFAVYGCSLGGGLTIYDFPLAPIVAGWEPGPLVGQPLMWLFTLPVRWLPAAWTPFLLKLFSAGVAALTLGLLARTVQLLPWDKPWATVRQRIRVLSVVTACAVCGLEFGFWQQATSATGEMLDLLLLATPLWLLLEFKARPHPAWLNAAAVVWGLGMAENWLMLLTLPLFVAALITLRRRLFFRWTFILRMAALGLAGFSIYALPPLVNGLTPHSPWNLQEAWVATLRQTKHVILMLYYGFWQSHRLLGMAVLIYYLVPTLPLLVRLRDDGTRNKSRVERFQLWIYRGLRVVLLLACLWLALDPATGPQQLVQHQLGTPLPMLSFIYLNGLGAGFLLGNLLLMPERPFSRRHRPAIKIPWRRFVAPVVAGSLAAVIAALLIRNVPAIVRLNYHPLEQFGSVAAKSLPTGGGVILSDFPLKLTALDAALARRRDGETWLTVDTRALPSVEYRARLERRRPAGWLTNTNRHPLNSRETSRLLQDVARTNRLFYLHPSFGAFFEAFYLEPAGLIYEMKLRPEHPLEIPPLPGAVTEANEKFWNRIWDSQLTVLASPIRPPAAWTRRFDDLGLTAAPRDQDRLLAEWYSLALDAWGVALQRQGRLPEARLRFSQALELNTNNLSARVSLACNTNLQAGTKMGLSDVVQVADQLGNPNRVIALLNNAGPFDEPTLGFLLGGVFLQTGQPLQAAEQFERVRALVPDALAAELELAETYNQLRMPGRSRPLIKHLRAEAAKLSANNSLDLNLALLDSYSWLLQTNVSNAQTVLEEVVEQHPDDVQIRSRVLGAYLALGDYTNALRLVEAQLAKSPDDVISLNNKAMVLFHAGHAAQAIPIFDRVLALTNLPAARLYRANAQLEQRDFTAAESDFHELAETSSTRGFANYGLASVAANRHDTNLASQYLRLCLTNLPVGSPLWRQAAARLQEFEPATAVK